jgi:hypothetical protein
MSTAVTYDNTLGVYDLALNRISHDLVFTPAPPGVSIWTINGQDKVAQQIKITLLAFLGEWFLDITFGVPYLEEILIKNPRMSTVESIIRSHILDVPHVLMIETLALDWDRQTRKLSVTFIADTDYGPINQSYQLDVINV